MNTVKNIELETVGQLRKVSQRISQHLNKTLGGYLGDSLAGIGSGVDTYRFTPAFTQAGQYRVSARWMASANRSDNVEISIAHGAVTSVVNVNQQQNDQQQNDT